MSAGFFPLWMFADVEVIGPNLLMISNAILLSGILTPIFSEPPVRRTGIFFFLNKTTVTGPGRNSSQNFSAAGFIKAIFFIISMFDTATDIGTFALFLTSKIFFTTSSLKGFPPIPYNVSVG